MEDIDEFIGNRVAKYIGSIAFFGSVVERIRGAVFAKQPDTGIGVFQVVWKIVYDDADVVHMTRTEIIAAMHTHKLLERNDYVGGGTGSDLHVLAEYVEEELGDINANPGLFGNATLFFDPRNRPLDMLPPDAKRNRLSFLVELVLDKFRKRISNEALKTRLRKDSTTFGATDIPTDIRSIGKFLVSRTLQEATRNRCGNDECSHAWIGALDPFDFDSNDCCLDCGTARYTRKGGKLVPRRIFYYFGAIQAIEGLH
jgi:hypothetical protein